MKKMIASLFFAMTLNLACYADEAATAPCSAACTEHATEEANQVAQADQEVIAQANDNKAMSSGSCATLPADQQNFAMQLNPGNKNMFCNSFNMDQRKSAMQMMTKPGTNGAKMTADQAVEQVAKNNNMAPGGKASSGCPVR